MLLAPRGLCGHGICFVADLTSKGFPPDAEYCVNYLLPSNKREARIVMSEIHLSWLSPSSETAGVCSSRKMDCDFRIPSSQSRDEYGTLNFSV